MTLEIYDGQYGKKMYPTSSSEETMLIKKYFNQRLELLVEKDGENITIYSRIKAIVTLEDEVRSEVLYLVYNDKYSENSFLQFKKEVEDTLHNIDGFNIQPIFDDDANNIFREIIKLDTSSITQKVTLLINDNNNDNNDDNNYSYDVILELLRSGNKLDFKTGNFDDIIAFWKDLIKNIQNIKMAVFTDDVHYEGDVNILLDKNPEASFAVMDRTKKILSEYKEKLEKNKKDKIRREEKDILILEEKKIDAAFNAIGTSINNVKNAGCDIEGDGDFIRIINKVKRYNNPVKSNKGTVIICIGLFVIGLLSGLAVAKFISDDKILNREDKSTESIVGVNTTVVVTMTYSEKDKNIPEIGGNVSIDNNETVNNNGTSGNNRTFDSNGTLNGNKTIENVNTR